MLRRRMLVMLGPVVGMLVLVAAWAIYSLQGVLAQMDHTAHADGAVEARAVEMSNTINEIEITLREVQLRRERHLDVLLEQMETLRKQVAWLGHQEGRPLPEGQGELLEIMRALPVFERHVSMLATTQDAALAEAHMHAALESSVVLRRNGTALAGIMRSHIAHEEEAAIRDFRNLVLVLGIAFLVVINGAVVVLLHLARTVLRPVDALVEASRRLAREEFETRVAVDGNDEFGELARAYNQLAEQLQANERRKLETLGQAAVMLNHELNNAGAIIKLQLQLMGRQSSGNTAAEKCLRQIHASLDRMTATVEALKRVRRIVLMPYDSETTMLDLARSVEESPEGEGSGREKKGLASVPAERM